MVALNLDLLSVGVAVAASLILGFIVLFGNYKSATNRLFLFFTIANSAWSVFNYLAYQTNNPSTALLIVRLVMFFATLQAYSFFHLVHTFPKSKLQFPIKNFLLLSLPVVVVLILIFTPLVFSGVEIQSGSVPQPVQAPGIILFGLVAVSSVIGGIILLIKKTLKASKEYKAQFKYLLAGVIIMFFLIIIFNFLFVVLFEVSSFIPLSAIFTLPFVVFASYAIVKHELLDIKIIGTEILTFILIIVAFVEVILSSSLGETVFRSGVFVALLVFGVLLIKSVVQEVKHREKLQELTDKLKELDRQKNEFISMAAHELRAPITAIKGYVSMIIEGDAGEISEKARGYLTDANAVNERLIRLVNNMLNVSRIEEGRLVYQMEVINLSRIAKLTFDEFKFEALRKELEFTLNIPDDIKDKVYVDSDRINEIFGNLVSNAVKFTKKGSISINLSQPKSGIVRVEIVDSGPGISDEEQKKLFSKFYRAESTAGKTIGTGLGLYISKLLVEKFGGKIGLSSEFGKGCTFWFELPLTSKKLENIEE